VMSCRMITFWFIKNGSGNFLSSCLLSKNIKVRIYKTVILPVVLYERETWSVTLREEQRLRVFENRVLWGIFGLRGWSERRLERTA
jgi:hypothetical protein